ncbi:MAG: hypothetical protein RJA61_499 [Candidatus Parcubacteria bacterium]|jgi:tRNA threonylcarbamoyladenosine biosynthesis protein TsaE
MEITHNLEEFKAFARRFVGSLKPQQKACVIGLSGNLGSGKTTFTQEIARNLGVTETVTSPTFVIEKIYTLPDSAIFNRLVHIDAYRIEKEFEMKSLRWEEIISDPKNLVIIEWGERIQDLMPKDVLFVSFKFINENTREIKIHTHER